TECVEPTCHPKIKRAVWRGSLPLEWDRALKELETSLHCQDPNRMLDVLKALVSSYAPPAAGESTVSAFTS
ncbi:MAG TPA: hypothetical protein VNK46_14755, partial [Nitrospiraceae bacterium]|nr:hypothetical protein [Nitrospiraceae bacterium]